MTIINNKIDNIQQNNNKNKMSEAKKRANKKYNAKTYKQKTIYIKLKDAEKIDKYMNEHQQSYSKFFNECLREKNIID